MIEEGIKGGTCHAIYQYAKANNKYMQNYDKKKESSYLQYWDVDNLYGWATSQKLQVKNFKWVKDISKFDERFIKGCNEASDIGFFLEVYVQYPENLHNLHNERMKIEKVEKHVDDLRDKTKYVIQHIRNLKETLNCGLVLKTLHRIVKFTQKAWLKPYPNMNTYLRKKAKSDFEKGFFKLMNYGKCEKTQSYQSYDN